MKNKHRRIKDNGEFSVQKKKNEDSNGKKMHNRAMKV
jgi:hypothetical protein